MTIGEWLEVLFGIFVLGVYVFIIGGIIFVIAHFVIKWW